MFKQLNTNEVSPIGKPPGLLVAEIKGFEPSRLIDLADYKSALLNHLSTSPRN